MLLAMGADGVAPHDTDAPPATDLRLSLIGIPFSPLLGQLRRERLAALGLEPSPC
jgi:hypothetical protein